MGTSQFDSVVNSVSMIDTDESENNELVGITEAVQVSDSVSESNVQGTTNTKPTYVIPVNTDPVNADTADLQQADDVFTSSP